MASSTLIPVAQYLQTTYRPDCDYIDGEVRGRNMGERPHALMQGVLCAIFVANRRTWNVLALPEQRVQTSERHFRIPDLCVVRPGDPADAIVQTAPLLCIEILSREDSLRDLQERVEDYTAMGVSSIWIIDPVRRLAYLGTPAGFVHPANDELLVPHTPIRIALADLFRQIEDLEADR